MDSVALPATTFPCPTSTWIDEWRAGRLIGGCHNNVAQGNCFSHSLTPDDNEFAPVAFAHEAFARLLCVASKAGSDKFFTESFIKQTQ